MDILDVDDITIPLFLDMVHALCYIVLCKTSEWVVGGAFHRGQSLGGGGQCDTCEPVSCMCL